MLSGCTETTALTSSPGWHPLQRSPRGVEKDPSPEAAVAINIDAPSLTSSLASLVEDTRENSTLTYGTNSELQVPTRHSSFSSVETCLSTSSSTRHASFSSVECNSTSSRSTIDIRRQASVSEVSLQKEIPPPFLDNDNHEELRQQLKSLASLVPELGRNMMGDARSYPFFCSKCEWDTETKVSNKPKPIAYAFGSCIVLSGCFCGCCMFPCMFDPCLEITHTCRDCGNLAPPPPANFTGNDSKWHSIKHI